MVMNGWTPERGDSFWKPLSFLGGGGGVPPEISVDF